MLLEMAVSAGCRSLVIYNARDFARVGQFGLQAVTPADILKTDRRPAVTTLIVRLPESPCKKRKSVAAREGVSIDQFVSTSVAENMSALMTEDCLAARGARASRGQCLAAREAVPDVEPDDLDK